MVYLCGIDMHFVLVAFQTALNINIFYIFLLVIFPCGKFLDSDIF